MAPDPTDEYVAEPPVFGTMRSGKAFIYAVSRADTGEIKIGRANNVSRRLRELQLGHGAPLELLVWFRHKPETERTLHRCFGEYRKMGEWFRDCERIRSWIERQRAKNLASRGFE